jgi:hypothetical protein
MQHLFAALQGGKQESRANAADWLAEIGDPAAIDPLKKVLAREKHDLPRGAMMAALERLGALVDEFLDRKGLALEAEQGLQKGIPSELTWFPFGHLPVVHWRDTGKAVDRSLLTWLLVQAYRTKNPEPSILLRRYVDFFRRDETENLGQFVLTAWIAHDTGLPTEA